MAKNVSTSCSRRRSPGCIELISIPDLPEIREGDDLARVIFAAARKARIIFKNTDIVVVAQKVVSKAEGRIARLSTVEPSADAPQLAAKGGRDPRLVEIILRESPRIVRDHPVLIVETQHGFVCHHQGMGASSVPELALVPLV